MLPRPWKSLRLRPPPSNAVNDSSGPTLDTPPSLDLVTLRRRYANGGVRPTEIIQAVYRQIAARGADAVWILLCPEAQALARARLLEDRFRNFAQLPLYGVPFAIKDNIDAAGWPTTAGCPDFAYDPPRNAPVVERLLAAGAILIGKTNLDQFATGLVGVRSPHGTPKNPFDARYIPGGSSSGSAVAVAAGLVSFALGTDTAGSGRVPAAFNNLVGFKPTAGLVSTTGVVPACRSLDCVSVFALTCEDAATVAGVVCARDAEVSGSRPDANGLGRVEGAPRHFRFGVPASADLNTFGDTATAPLFAEAVARLLAIGGERVEVDFAPFRETAALLYGGPWVAERLAAIREFFERQPQSVFPVTRQILAGAHRFTAVDAYEASYRLEALRLRTQAEWQKMDVLFLPTTGTTYTIAEVEADPLQLNTNLGYYTNFVNLLNCCALAVPSGWTPRGLPFGITFIAPALRDGLLFALGTAYHHRVGGRLGATRALLSDSVPPPPGPPPATRIRVAVVGAHLQGLPLNHQLTERGAVLVRRGRTLPAYRLYALPGTTPPKPGLVRCPQDGQAIELEVWEMPIESFGAFVTLVSPPLTIGTLELEDGERVKGFLCEGYAVEAARDITQFGGWRRYLLAAAMPP